MEDHNVFAGAFVDRSGERRKDSDWLAEAALAPERRFVPVWRDQCLLGSEPPGAVLLERAEVEASIDDDELIFLGVFRDHPAFAVAVESDEAPFEQHGEFHELRYLGTVLPLDEANLVGMAPG